VSSSSVTVLKEDCSCRDQLNHSSQLPNLHLRDVGVLELEEDDVVQLQVSTSGLVHGGDEEMKPVHEDPVFSRADFCR